MGIIISKNRILGGGGEAPLNIIEVMNSGGGFYSITFDGPITVLDTESTALLLTQSGTANFGTVLTCEQTDENVVRIFSDLSTADTWSLVEPPPFIIEDVVNPASGTCTFVDYRTLILSRGTLLHYWPMDEASGTTLAGTNANITINGATPGVAGHHDGTAVSFDGVNDFGQSASLNLSAHSKIAVECWFLWDSFTNNDDLLLEFTANANTNNGAFIVNPNASGGSANMLHVAHRGAVGTNNANYTRPSAAAWHHFVAILDFTLAAASEVALYLDGSLATIQNKPSSNENTGASVFANSVLNLMSRNGGSLFGAGDMQHLAIYSSLTAAKILENYQKGNE